MKNRGLGLHIDFAIQIIPILVAAAIIFERGAAYYYAILLFFIGIINYLGNLIHLGKKLPWQLSSVRKKFFIISSIYVVLLIIITALRRLLHHDLEFLYYLFVAAPAFQLAYFVITSIEVKNLNRHEKQIVK